MNPLAKFWEMQHREYFDFRVDQVEKSIRDSAQSYLAAMGHSSELLKKCSLDWVERSTSRAAKFARESATEAFRRHRYLRPKDVRQDY